MPHTRRSRFRRLRCASLLLVLGLGTTVAVAWAVEVWSQRFERSLEVVAPPLTGWFVDLPSPWPSAPKSAVVFHGIGRTETTAFISRVDAPPMFTSVWQREVRVGLPLRSLRRVHGPNASSGRRDVAPHLSRVQTGLPLPAWLGVNPSEDRRLPLLPLWPGLAANTLFYALPWWLGLAARRAAIRDKRFRRGLCPVCRYDLAFNNTPGCPECGWRRA